MKVIWCSSKSSLTCRATGHSMEIAEGIIMTISIIMMMNMRKEKAGQNDQRQEWHVCKDAGSADFFVDDHDDGVDHCHQLPQNDLEFFWTFSL